MRTARAGSYSSGITGLSPPQTQRTTRRDTTTVLNTTDRTSKRRWPQTIRTLSYGVIRRRGSDGRHHGTHITGIAAGNGEGTSSHKGPGVAPEADIVFVCLKGVDDRKLAGSLPPGGERIGRPTNGDSVDVLEAVDYIFREADRLSRPAVVNLSMGGTLGPHDGTSMLEQGIDHLLQEQGKAIVAAAGNQANTNKHASGTITSEANARMRLNIAGNVGGFAVDIWYAGADTFDVSIGPSGVVPVDVSGNGIQWFHPADETQVATLSSGTEIAVDSGTEADSENGKKRIYIRVSKKGATQVDSGVWILELAGAEYTDVHDGDFHAWIQKYASVSFNPADADTSGTVTIPGTSKKVITVANYRNRNSNRGQRYPSSGIGPTAIGDDKPDIAAPGSGTYAPAADISSGDNFTRSGGTSAAAPYVSGTVAVMLEKNPYLTQGDVKDFLTESACCDPLVDPALPGSLPDHEWGAGKLDVDAALRLVPSRQSGDTILSRAIRGHNT